MSEKLDSTSIPTLPALTALSVAFILSIPFFDVPRLGIPGVPLAAYLGTALVGATALTGGLRIPKIPALIFGAFWIVYSLSFLVNAAHLEERATHHVLLYALSFLWFYLAPYQAYIHLGVERVQRYFFWGALALALVGTVEVSLFYRYDAQAYASFLNHEENVGVFLGVLPRMRSLFNEPSHLAIYVLGITPIIWNVNKVAKLTVIYLLAWTFSASAWIGVFCASIAFAFYRFVFSRSTGTKFVALTSMALVALFWQQIFQIPFFQKVVAVFGSGQATTQAPRYFGLVESLQYLDDRPLLGLGPTFYYAYTTGGLFNLYLQIYIEAGLLGLTLFCAFYISHYRRTVDFRRPVFFVPFVALLVQYAAMNHYYIPGIWVMLSYMSYLTASASHLSSAEKVSHMSSARIVATNHVHNRHTT